MPGRVLGQQVYWKSSLSGVSKCSSAGGPVRVSWFWDTQSSGASPRLRHLQS